VPVCQPAFALTAGLATALIGGTAPLVAQLLVTFVDLEAAPGIYVAVMSGLALIALAELAQDRFQGADLTGFRSLVRLPKRGSGLAHQAPNDWFGFVRGELVGLGGSVPTG
jgi:hypothetical protein